ncbi:MAG: DUF2334 domain-containing protein, partial [Candidatus Paceibacterota bacterium]
MIISILGATYPLEVTAVVQSENETAFSYELKHNFDSETKKALFITSNYPGEYAHTYEKKFKAFKDIVTSHWNLDITMISQEEYVSGMIEDYEIIFYIKEEREPTPELLFKEILNAKEKRIVLSGYNDLIVNNVIGSNIAIHENVSQDISYKGVRFYDQDLTLLYNTNSLIRFKDSLKFFGFTRSSPNKRIHPFSFAFDNRENVGEGSKSNFFVFPFLLPDYYSTNSYTTIFLDLLYEAFGIDVESKTKPALIRIEDINVKTYYQPKKLRRVYDLFREKDIPFHIAFIVKYVNPEEDIEMLPNDGRRFHNLLKQMVGGGGGVMVQHGYTHQIEDSVSGIGFEFWDEDKDAPLEYESVEFVVDRINSAKTEMRNAGLPVTDIWETPHYTRSEMADEIFSAYYPIRYENNLNVGHLPFPAKIDGTIYIPENLGYINDSHEEYHDGYSVKELRENLERLSVFRNPTASFFWHPWREFDEIKKLIEIFEEEGYTFVSAYDLLDTKESSENDLGLAGLNDYSTPISYLITNVFIALIYIFFTLGCLFYIRTILRLRRFAKVFDTFNMSIEKLEDFLKAHNKKFPFFTIFVPARNEAFVIERTIKRLASLDYPKSAYEVTIIVDERELKDDVEVFTKDVAKKVGKELNKRFGVRFINVIEVPEWYSGRYNDNSNEPRRSTKGRALNFALQKMKTEKRWERTDMIGVLDADGRLHPNVLKEAAFKRIVKNSKVLQGPVLQVSNFKNVSIVGVAAGIELAIHHLAELPYNLIMSKRVQFLAGTNYFIEKDLIDKVGGWNQESLVEDAELALRVFIQKGVKADWIRSPEIEQTPENFAVYKKQRSRWVRGHLDLIKDIRNSQISLRDKLSFYWKIFVSQFRFVLDLGFPILGLTFLFLGVF